MKYKIAILDDEKEILSSLSNIFLKEGHETFAFQNTAAFFETLKTVRFDILFLDIFLGHGIDSGIDVLRLLKRDYPDINVIMISGNADIKTAVEAVKIGARDFIEKPLHLKEVLKAVDNIISKLIITNERNQLLDDVLSRYEMTGSSDVMKRIKETIIEYSGLNEPVLITGESGTGKELVAANLHYYSERRSCKYHKINIASLSENLIESELFGHKKGSFSGALENKEGLFKIADNSTLFVDEIGDLKYDIQSKLLRAIQEKEIIPVGSSEPISFNTRLVFATNKNLLEETKNGGFREDLYYRISVLKINIPPLRERKGDIRAISEKIIKDFCIENNRPLKSLGAGAVEKLQRYDFPGNIRELKNILIQAVLLSRNDDLIDGTSVFFETQGKMAACEDIFDETRILSEKKKILEKKYIEKQLEKHKENLQDTASSLGILVNNLYRKIKELDIKI